MTPDGHNVFCTIVQETVPFEGSVPSNGYRRTARYLPRGRVPLPYKLARWTGEIDRSCCARISSITVVDGQITRRPTDWRCAKRFGRYFRSLRHAGDANRLVRLFIVCFCFCRRSAARALIPAAAGNSTRARIDATRKSNARARFTTAAAAATAAEELGHVAADAAVGLGGGTSARARERVLTPGAEKRDASVVPRSAAAAAAAVPRSDRLRYLSKRPAPSVNSERNVSVPFLLPSPQCAS